jgi:hypothetical protein
VVSLASVSYQTDRPWEKVRRRELVAEVEGASCRPAPSMWAITRAIPTFPCARHWVNDGNCARSVLETQPVGTGPAKSHRIKLPISFAETGFNGWEPPQYYRY